MGKPRVPRSIQAATQLLEQFAELDGQIAAIEAERQHAIASVNARADTAANDLIGRRQALQAVLESWWSDNAASLTDGKRKSIELGGCLVGSKMSRPSLVVEGEEAKVAARLSAHRWAKSLLRVRLSLNRPAALEALGGARAAVLAELGLTRREGEERFFVERAEQTGTLAGAG